MNRPAPLDRRSDIQVFPDMTMVNGNIQRTSPRPIFSERGRRGRPGEPGARGFTGARGGDGSGYASTDPASLSTNTILVEL
jgi:hypothetical protein